MNKPITRVDSLLASHTNREIAEMYFTTLDAMHQAQAAASDAHEKRKVVYDSLRLEESKSRKLQHRLDHTGIRGWLHRLRHQVG